MSSPKSWAIITKNETPAAIMQEGWEKCKAQGMHIPSDAEILLILDTPLPEGCPASVNPDSLVALLKLVQKENPKKIWVVGSALYGTFHTKNLRFLGLDAILSHYGINFVELHDWEEHCQEFLKSIHFTILLSQVKVDPLFGIKGSLLTLVECSPLSLRKNAIGIPISSTGTESSPNMNLLLQLSAQMFQWKPLDLVINDMYYVLDQNGPMIQSNSKEIVAKTIVFSNNALHNDLTVMQLCGININSNGFYRTAAQNFTYFNASSDNLLPDASITRSVTLHIPSFDLKKIYIPGLNLCLGTIDTDTLYALYLCLTMLQSVCIKDAIHMGKWYLLGGTNPPSPKSDAPIVLFGNPAIQSTKNYEFRQEIKLKKAMTSEELDNIIFRNDNIMRDTIRKLEAHYRSIEDQINLKDDLFEREEAQILAKQKLALSIAKIEYKKRRSDLKLRMQNNKAGIQNLVPQIKLNEKILEIPGNPPSGWDGLAYLANFWTMYDNPTMRIFIDFTTQYYAYPPIDLDLMKITWKNLQKSLKLLNTEKYAPIKIEMNTKIKTLTLEYKQADREEKLKYQKLVNEIKEKFKPQLVSVKERKKQQKAANKKPSVPPPTSETPSSGPPLPVNSLSSPNSEEKKP